MLTSGVHFFIFSLRCVKVDKQSSFYDAADNSDVNTNYTNGY